MFGEAWLHYEDGRKVKVYFFTPRHHCQGANPGKKAHHRETAYIRRQDHLLRQRSGRPVQEVPQPCLHQVLLRQRARYR